MDYRDKILSDREQKNIFIKSLVNDYQVISLKANIPGIAKQTKEAYILVNYFNNVLKSLGYNTFKFLDGYDGPMYIYLTDKSKVLKDKMMEVEEQDLGRFVDIDVFNNNISMNRSNLRKCYLCNLSAVICSRNQNHSIEELNEFISNNVFNRLCSIIKKICNEAILEELNLHPKFGLVTPFSNGSHQDMNYELMIKAKDAILDSFVEMFIVGYTFESINDIFIKIRNIGLNAEEKMMKATNNINAYKGLIFVLGLVVASIGYKLAHLNKDINIFDVIKEMTKGITKELNYGVDTFGKQCYQQYGIKGARGEAEDGLPHVQFALDNKYEDIYQLLIYYISNIDDTVLLKRAKSYSQYLEIRKWFQQDINIEELTNECINLNLSFGGAADLLIVTLFVRKFNNIITII